LMRCPHLIRLGRVEVEVQAAEAHLAEAQAEQDKFLI